MMIDIFLKAYFDLIVSVLCISAVLFLFGLYFIVPRFFRGSGQSLSTRLAKEPEVDYSAFAGDDYIATQLDLARAFIETNQVDSAKEILQQVMTHGSSSQKQEANQLMGLI